MESSVYEIGLSADYDPAQRRSRHMLRLVAYDITRPKRLARVAKICQNYGVRVEYSVFECDLSDEKFDQFWAQLNAAINPAYDSLLAYPLCAGCIRKISSAGIVKRPEKALLYIL
jgi:CRISPR-associated protein Cas2